ncbi:MAG: CoA transferase subunit A [Candidatus Latescibacterota bacterium]|nr:MAG: CoA transferase subunit A [Candidatus Latescibacterota bacterium]
MDILEEGHGELLGFHDPDEHRAWVAANKSPKPVDKRMSVAEAVERFIPDGSYIASGGFGHIRVAMAVIYEIIRRRRRNLAIAGKTAVHDFDILMGAGCISKCETAYSFGHELRGLSPASRRAVETGKVEVVAETSNAGYQWRFLGGMLGVPFVPSRNLLGTDTLRYSSAKVAVDPFTGKPVTLIPSANPDVVLMHVPRCDMYGNCQIDGILVMDFELSRSARRLIVTTERVIDNEEIRSVPWRTVIPHMYVDAVCEVPYGSHPCQMPGLYFFDEEIIGEWLADSKTDEGAAAYFDKYVFGVKDFAEYLELAGGAAKLEHLRRVERLEEPMRAPWLERKKG